jgi:hypothetical protein
VNAHQRSHRLHRPGKPVQPRRLDLQALLAKELGLKPAPKRRRWPTVAFSTCVFVAGITIATHGTEFNNVWEATPDNGKRENLSDRIGEHKQIQLAEITMSHLHKAKALAIDWQNASPLSIGLILEPVPVSLSGETAARSVAKRPVGSPTIKPVAITRRALLPEERLELEFWRPIVRSGNIEAYRAYLNRYPSGAFTAIATAKVKELDRNAREVSLKIPEEGTATKNGMAKPSKVAKPKASAKSASLTPPARQPESPASKPPSAATAKPSLPGKSAAVAASAPNTSARCRDTTAERCKEPLSRKECVRSAGDSSSLCVIRNYQSATKAARP